MANAYISSTAWLALPQWAPSVAYTLGQYIRNRGLPSYAAVGLFSNSGGSGQQITANFGGSAFANAAPSGFSAWDPAATFDPANLGANLTLSNGNLTVTSATAVNATNVARSTTARQTGKWYYELTSNVLTGTAAAQMFGIINSSGLLTSAPGSGNTNGTSISNASGTAYNVLNPAGFSMPAIAQGNIIGVAVDIDNGWIWFRIGAGIWNNNAGANPATGVGGISLSGVVTVAYGNDRVFKCTTAGTSGTTEPSWSLADGATTADGTVTWTQVAGRETEQAAGNWKAPFGSVKAWHNAHNTDSNSYNVFVSSDHFETTPTGQSFGNYISGAAPWQFISVNKAGSLPPVNADYQKGATIKTLGNNGLTLQNCPWWGFNLFCADGNSAASFVIGQSNNGSVHCEDCTLTLGGTGTGVFTFGSTSTFPSFTKFVNSKFQFGAVGQSFSIQQTQTLEFIGGAIIGTVVPTYLFTFPSSNPPRTIKVHGMDLSLINTRLFNNNGWFGQFDMWDCKLNAAVSLAVAYPSDALSELRVINCDSGSNMRYMHALCNGVVTSDTQVARTGGASDGVTPFSHKITPNNVNGSLPYMAPAISGWVNRRVNTVGTPVTLTMEAIIFTNRAITNQDLWMEVEVLDSAGVPLASFYSTRALLSGTALTASTSAWDSVAPLRQNSTSYAANSVIRVASNPGRLFMNNTGSQGASAASEPAGFASATDGGSQISDGSNWWIVGTRVKFQQAITPQVKGLVRARLVQRYTGAINQTCFTYLDPKLYIA